MTESDIRSIHDLINYWHEYRAIHGESPEVIQISFESAGRLLKDDYTRRLLGDGEVTLNSFRDSLRRIIPDSGIVIGG